MVAWEGGITIGHKKAFGGILTIVMISQVCTYVKAYQIVYFKYVQIIMSIIVHLKENIWEEW